MPISADTRRPENLALLFQDVLTAIVRLRANRQGVTDANAFRHHMREALKTAASQALAAGYTADDTKHATFAAVAFLDESVLNSQNAHKHLFKLNSSYDISKDTKVYATFSEGFRRGGAAGLPPEGIYASVPQYFTYQPDFSKNYESASRAMS